MFPASAQVVTVGVDEGGPVLRCADQAFGFADSGTRRLIERDGWEKVSIRRLAAEIGIAPTTLYHHVRDK